MQPPKNIVSLLLVFLMLGSGLPVAHLGDVSQDGRTDLQDVILSVRDLARTAETSGALTPDFKQVVTALSAVAGLKTVIKRAGDAGSTASVQGVDAPYLKYTIAPIALTASWSGLDIPSFHYRSIHHKPTLPPPQIS